MDVKLAKLRLSLTILVAILMFGTSGYYFLEKMSLFDAFYMTVITISTVGFSEIKPLSVQGRAVTVSIIAASMTVGAYSIGVAVRMLIEGEIRKTFGRRRLKKQISQLKDHFIVCGYGRIGRIICDELYADAIDFVVIDQDRETVETIEEKGYLYLRMDATTESALMEAGIMQAKGLVAAVRSDANNIFITLTARGIRSDLYILGRTTDMRHESKLKYAGATRVIAPYLIGGRRMAQVLKRPTVVDFIDIATVDSKLGLMMEEAQVQPESDLVGKNLIESRLRKDFGVIIVAIKKSSGNMVFNPMPKEVLDAGDVLVVLGKRDDLKRMSEVM